MTLSENKTIEFRKENWLILIKETPETYEAYIQEENYYISLMMFGLSKEDIDYISFVELVEEDLYEYQENYKERYIYD